MAKKKSKTQKYKKNLKKKQNKATKIETKVAKKAEIESETKPIKEKQLVEKDKVKYNVPITSPETIKKEQNKKKTQTPNTKKVNTKPANKKVVKTNSSSTTTVKKSTPKKEEIIAKNEPVVQKIDKKTTPKQSTTKKINLSVSLDKIKNYFAKKLNLKVKEKSSQAKQTSKSEPVSKKNVFLRLMHELITNNHIIFNTALILFFLVLILALVRIEVFKTGTIIYISAIILFLIIIAISYTKYLSGKVFTIVLCIGMGFAIYQMQYTYDFVRNLASNLYEYKTYYVVTFDNGINKSIYTINNKSVGLLKDNCINVERRLNTKLDGIKYMEYDDINQLFDDFYDSKFRAILVNENQYKYLQNNIQGNKDVKILYEFKVNSKK